MIDNGVFRELTLHEIDEVSGAISAGEAAAMTAGAAIGGAIGATAGSLSGSEFGALLGTALCAPGGPEASAACAVAGAYLARNLGTIEGRDAGTAMGGYLADELYKEFSDVFNDSSYSTDISNEYGSGGGDYTYDPDTGDPVGVGMYDS